MSNSSDLYDPDHVDVDDIAPAADINAINKSIDSYYEPRDTDKGAVFIAPDLTHQLMAFQNTSVKNESIDYEQYTSSKQSFTEDTDDLSDFVLTNTEIMIPIAPFMILPTSFRCCMGKDELVEKISQILTSMEVSFELSCNLAEFNAVYVNGSIYIKFQIHLYTETGLNVFGEEPEEKIVEAQRQIGDGFAFNSIFGELRKVLLEETDEVEISLPTAATSSSPRLMRCDSFGSSSTSGRLTRSSSLNTSAYCSIDDSATDMLIAPLSEEEKQLFLDPIKRMTEATATIDSQLEGCRLLCDMVTSHSNFHEQLLSSGCVEILIRLALGTHFLTCQHAVIALVELSATPGCMKAIWKAVQEDGQCNQFVEFLCEQLVDGPYYSESKRRKSANLLVNMLEYLMNACDAVEGCTMDTNTIKLNIDKYKHHIEMINMRVISPRSCRKPGEDIFNMNMSIGIEQQAEPFGLNFVSESVPISRQTSDISKNFYVKEEPLQDKVLENCINRIQTIMEKDSELDNIILDLSLGSTI